MKITTDPLRPGCHSLQFMHSSVAHREKLAEEIVNPEMQVFGVVSWAKCQSA